MSSQMQQCILVMCTQLYLAHASNSFNGAKRPCFLKRKLERKEKEIERVEVDCSLAHLEQKRKESVPSLPISQPGRPTNQLYFRREAIQTQLDEMNCYFDFRSGFRCPLSNLNGAISISHAQFLW
ncbi:Uncharacterized protein APZ42_012612 [Daphnia magna]|uniref:Uncharacterized protein n=1 Tax=Daphnia magna TaxID=35525 RepID=A0A162RNX4_9CRUS|nr:Uncharacterized protein APZ42_012612 [Daphnia magna]